MTAEEKLDLVGDELANAIRDIAALSDLVAMLMAELASIDADPTARLREMIEDEKAAAYAAATVHSDLTEGLERTLMRKAAKKAEAFDLATKIMRRIEGTRRG